MANRHNGGSQKSGGVETLFAVVITRIFYSNCRAAKYVFGFGKIKSVFCQVGAYPVATDTYNRECVAKLIPDSTIRPDMPRLAVQQDILTVRLLATNTICSGCLRQQDRHGWWFSEGADGRLPK